MSIGSVSNAECGYRDATILQIPVNARRPQGAERRLRIDNRMACAYKNALIIEKPYLAKLPQDANRIICHLQPSMLRQMTCMQRSHYGI
jgi:hypothetical protein